MKNSYFEMWTPPGPLIMASKGGGVMDLTKLMGFFSRSRMLKFMILECMHEVEPRAAAIDGKHVAIGNYGRSGSLYLPFLINYCKPIFTCA